MGLTFLTGYLLGQHGRQSARLASVAGSGTGPKLEDLLDIHERLDRLALVVEAMWSLLEEGGYTAEQLKARIDEIDSSDGVDDGRRTARAAQCRHCGAMVAPGLPACQFCGTAIPGNDDNPLRTI